MSHRNPLWERLHSARSSLEKSSILQQLYTNLQTPSNDDAAALTEHIPALDGSQRYAFLLLARWARQLALRSKHDVPHSHLPTHLQRSIDAALGALKAHGSGSGAGSAAAVFLATALGVDALDAPNVHHIAEALASSLLRLTTPPSWEATSSLIAATGTSLPPLVKISSPAATWIVTGMLHACSLLSDYQGVEHHVINALSPAYPIFRSALSTSLVPVPSTAAPPNAVKQPMTDPLGFYESVYGLLRTIVVGFLDSSTVTTRGLTGEGMMKHNTPSEPPAVAVASLALGGLLEGASRLLPTTRPPLLSQLQSFVNGVESLLHICAAKLPLCMNGLPLVNIACGLAIAQVYQACHRPSINEFTSTCLTSTLASSFEHVTADLAMMREEGLAATSSASLHATLTSLASDAFMQAIPSLAGAAALHVRHASPTEENIAMHLRSLQMAAQATHARYREYSLRFARPDVDLQPVLAALQRHFAPIMDVLRALCEASARLAYRTVPDALGAGIVSIVSDLQFCRVQTPAYAQVLRWALMQLPVQPNAALTVVNDLPPYAQLQESVEIRQQQQPPSPQPAATVSVHAPAWIADGVTAAKVQLLLGALAPCIGALPSDIVLDVVAPIAFLFLKHPHFGTRDTAHRILWSMFASLPEDEAAKLGPFYVHRCLEGLTGVEEIGKGVYGCTDNDGNSGGNATPPATQVSEELSRLGQGLATLFTAIKRPSGMELVCLERLAEKCGQFYGKGGDSDVLATSAASTSTMQDGVLHKDPLVEMMAVVPINPIAAASIFRVASEQVFTVHYALVDAATEILERCVLDCPHRRLRGRLCAEAFAVVFSSADTVRKTGLVRWCQRLARSAAV